MRKISFLLFIFLAIPVFLSAETKTGDIHVTVDGIVHLKGTMKVALFNNEKGFPNKKEVAFRKLIFSVEKESMVFHFPQVPYGTYAVAVFHDLNNDGKMKKSFLGIPKEPLGISNNLKIRFSAPKFKDAKFDLDSPDHNLTVHLATKNSTTHAGAQQPD